MHACMHVCVCLCGKYPLGSPHLTSNPPFPPSRLTPNVQAVEAESNGFADMTVIEGDFFTYADVRKDYWSGYYTSRPFYKELGMRR